MRFHLASIALMTAALLTKPALAAFSDGEWQQIKLAVANDIDALVGDTVNEGEVQAFVLRKGREKAPVMTCRDKELTSRELHIILCDVTFRVKAYEAEWTERTCNLTHLLHTDRRFPTLTRGQDAIFQRCLETLNEAD